MRLVLSTAVAGLMCATALTAASPALAQQVTNQQYRAASEIKDPAKADAALAKDDAQAAKKDAKIAKDKAKVAERQADEPKVQGATGQ